MQTESTLFPRSGSSQFVTDIEAGVGQQTNEEDNSKWR
jgi:hypothetical protein